MCFRRERRSRGAIGFQVQGIFKKKQVTLELVVRFSIQTKGQAIRSDFYVETEEYAFSLTSPQGQGYVHVSRRDGKYVCDTSEGIPEDIIDAYPAINLAGRFFGAPYPADDRQLLYPSGFESLFPFASEISRLMSFHVFRINPRTARQSGAPSVFGQLGKFGENLPSALDSLFIDHPKTFETLEEMMKGVIPGFTSLRTRYTASRQMGLFLQEGGFGSPWDAEELSDGTLMSMALFLAILHPQYKRIVIEEPENSLHPWILRKFLSCCKDLSETKQILLTTQSPLVVATASPENLFLVEREEGMTRVVPALERESILPEMLRRQFLDLGQYWMSGGLGAVPVVDSDQHELFTEESE